ncbi:MAG: glycoside hydrolase family 2 [Bacteroidaceae bacterium]|nr:glycoside hydrolase family 2 [Bacteroidaceae bacterium]
MAFSYADSSVRNESLEQMELHFASPPAEAKPRLWWHWMNGNITLDGIRKDLLWMHDAGIGGFQHFDAAIGVPTVVKERLAYMSDGWKDAFRYAIALGDSLDMEMAIPCCPGWSTTGGPWVEPEDAMKKIVWKEMRVAGGSKVSVPLPPPFSKAGYFQNLVYSGEEYYEDIAVVALRMPEEDRPVQEMSVSVTSSSNGDFTIEQLANDDLTDGIVLPQNADGGPAWIQLEFPQPTAFRAVSTCDGRVRPWPYNIGPSMNVTLEKSDDGNVFTEVARIPSTACHRSTVSFPEARARFFRLRVDNEEVRISEFRLYQTGRVNHAEEKAGFASPHDIHDFPTVTDGDFATEVINLTNHVTNGMLVWDAPEGNWKVLRIGWSLTGRKNGPAPAEATGLEVDKLNPEAWTNFFHHYLDMYKETCGDLFGARGIRYLLSDSYEGECQNWTPDMMREFRERRGYDLLHWLPVLTGEVVESIEKTEAFLWDWNVTIAELYAENYDLLDQIIKKYGMVGRYSEAHECGRAYVSDGMDVKRSSAIPMGACWIDAGSPTMAAADIRESASVAHIYGQNLVAAESLTANGTPATAYKYTPRSLKKAADWEMAHGVNRFVIHESAHQPYDSIFPGLGLGPYGQWFNRHETWASQARCWTDYMARSCYMLQQGQAVADILIYYGEDSNVCSQYGNGLPDFIPTGYNYDYAGPTVLKDLLKVKGGKLKAGMMDYRVLYLGKNVERMSVDVLQCIVKLAEDGAVICGHTPQRPASMMDDSLVWNRLRQRLCKGRNVYLEKPLDEVLAVCGIQPDVEYDRADWSPNIRFVHRHTKKAEIYWINRYEEKGKTMEFSFRQSGLRPRLWHPETGKTEDVSYRMEAGRTTVRLDLVPEDAVFVVFAGRADKDTVKLKKTETQIAAKLIGPWNVTFQKERSAPESAIFDTLYSFTNHPDPGIKYFSGAAVYASTFFLKGNPSEGDILIDLGEVCDLARVRLNGTDCGVVWKQPYRLSITEAVRSGENQLEVTVWNPWHNRLVGDVQPDCEHPITYTSNAFFNAQSPLLPAGLLGPVTVMVKKGR